MCMALPDDGPDSLKYAVAQTVSVRHDKPLRGTYAERDHPYDARAFSLTSEVERNFDNNATRVTLRFRGIPYIAEITSLQRQANADLIAKTEYEARKSVLAALRQFLEQEESQS